MASTTVGPYRTHDVRPVFAYNEYMPLTVHALLGVVVGNRASLPSSLYHSMALSTHALVYAAGSDLSGADSEQATDARASASRVARAESIRLFSRLVMFRTTY